MVSFFFKSLQYLLGILLPVNISITSTTEKYHFSSFSFQCERIFFSSNNFILLIYSPNIKIILLLTTLQIYKNSTYYYFSLLDLRLFFYFNNNTQSRVRHLLYVPSISPPQSQFLLQSIHTIYKPAYHYLIKISKFQLFLSLDVRHFFLNLLLFQQSSMASVGHLEISIANFNSNHLIRMIVLFFLLCFIFQ